MFVREIRRFDEMERKIRIFLNKLIWYNFTLGFLESQVRKDGIDIVDIGFDENFEAISHAEINQLEVYNQMFM